MLTVLIATHNGSDTLDRTFANLAAAAAPDGGWKLVVVNNASTDDTEEIISRWQGRLPLCCIREPQLGKSNALNTGFTAAEGDLVVMTDDDVLVDIGWLRAWRAAADDNREYALFGGAIEPEFERTPPAWLTERAWLIPLFGATDPARPEGETSATEIYGSNMGVRVAALALGVRFNTGLMIGSAGTMGEDTDFCRRLADKGCRAYFVPKARLRHIVHEAQVRWSWMLRRFYRHGKTQLQVELRQHGHTTPEVFSVPRYLLRRVATNSLGILPAVLSFRAQRIFSQLRLISYDLGAIAGARDLAQRQ